MALDTTRDESVVWWCEPGGVTIRYHRGSPLGILQAVILPEPSKASLRGDSPIGQGRPGRLLKPIDIGAADAMTADVTGTLYLRVNDSPGELSDNRGQIEVTISAK